ncbi:nucleotide disphospho-sugar-binding domain-containing protein, partial [Sinosporangium siamense]
LGTSATERLDGYSVPIQDILTSLGDLDIEVVATIPDAQRDQLTHVPDNVRTVPFVPLSALVPTCSAVIHHGGGGSFSTSSINGVPQLVLANMVDAPIKGQMLHDRGAGIFIPSEQATGPAVREALHRLLTEPSYRRDAGRLREEMFAMPSPADVVPELEKLAFEYRAAPAQAAHR